MSREDCRRVVRSLASSGVGTSTFKFKFAFKFKDELFVLLHLEAPLLHLDLQIDILLQSGIDLVRCELGESFLEEVDLELDVEVLFLEGVDML